MGRLDRPLRAVLVALRNTICLFQVIRLCGIVRTPDSRAAAVAANLGVFSFRPSVVGLAAGVLLVFNFPPRPAKNNPTCRLAYSRHCFSH